MIQRLKIKYLNHQQFMVIISILIGLATGLVAVALKNLTFLFQSLTQKGSLAIYFIFPFLGLYLTYLVIKYVLKKEVGQGIAVTLRSISREKGVLDKFQGYASLITAPITAGFGGSVGLEAPTVVTGAAIGSQMSRRFKLNQASRNLLIGCAAAGAMSSIFKAPIAGIIFAIEIFSLDLTLASMIPLLTASVSAILTSYFFFGNELILHTVLEEKFHPSDVPFFILLGVFAAIFSIYFTKIYFSIIRFFKRIKRKRHRMVAGGIGLGVLVFLFPPLYGEGYDIINSLLQGNYEVALGNSLFASYASNMWVVIGVLTFLVFFKIVATSLTVSAGGVGGIFAPVLFMGSVMGHAFALLINTLPFIDKPISVTNFTLVGMAGLMAGVMSAPLTAIFLIAEITSGYELFIPLMITAAIAYFVTNQFQPHSVYTMELAESGDVLTHNKDQTVMTLMEIEQVIETNFVSIELNMTLGEIVQNGVIKSSRNLFPVVDSENHFLGIILLDDIRGIMFEEALYNNITASDVMVQAPEIIDLSNCKIQEIMDKFQGSKAWNLPVVRDGKYVGFVSKSKLLTAYRQKLIEVSM
jgi:CIC family chloride channel protein